MRGTWLTVASAALAAGCSSGVTPDAGDAAADIASGSDVADAASGDAGLADGFSSLAFGANLSWPNRADGVVLHGDLLRDRSFRAHGRSNSPWQDVALGGTITYAGTGGDDHPAGENASPGYVEIARTNSGLSCVTQLLAGELHAGTNYTAYFSSYGVAGTPTILFALEDAAFSTIHAAAMATASNGAWQHHELALTPTTASPGARAVLCLQDAGTLRVDEVRLIEPGTPALDPTAVTQIRALGVRALRWGSGTTLDSQDWRQTVGRVLERGELAAYREPTDALNTKWETPAFGLHEFLDACEALGVTPLLGVNVLDTPASAGELVEYVLGGPDTPGGMLRASRGHLYPWDSARYFEIGNEPAFAYTADGVQSDDDATGGPRYGALARAVADAMHAKAASLSRNIAVSGVLEGSFQLADWIATPTPQVEMLRDWNTLAFAQDTGLGGATELAHAHFYSYFGHDDAESDEFRHVMSAGTVLGTTLATKLRPAAGAASVWITEYNVQVYNSAQSIAQDRLVDFQSGLAVADTILALVRGGVQGAFAFNLSEQTGFGLLRANAAGFPERPAGVVFAMLSPLADDTALDAVVTADPGGAFTVTPGIGNIPSGLRYDLVSSLVTRDNETHRPRIVLLNRDFAVMQTVSVDIPGFAGGDATVIRYEGSVRDNNETDPSVVRAVVSSAHFDNPVVVSLAPHSLVRIDF